MRDKPTLTLDEETKSPKVILHGEWKSEYAQLFEAQGYRALELNGAKGFYGDDLEFLAEIPSLEELTVIDSIPSVRGVRHCGRLRKLELNTPSKDAIDFTQFAHLEDLSPGHLGKRGSALHVPTLRKLYVDGYPYPDCTPISAPSLESLMLGPASRLDSLDGIERWQATLREVDIFRAPRLVDIGKIEQLTCLESFELSYCKRVRSIDALRKILGLKRLVLADCGKIESFSPLRGMKNLRMVVFDSSTEIEDGDLSVFSTLPALDVVGFMERRHYTHNREQVKEIIGRRF